MDKHDHLFHLLEPGKLLLADGSMQVVPANIEVGEDTKADSASIFKNFFSKLPVGLRVGSNVTFFRSYLATEEAGYIQIGDYTFMSNASIACNSEVVIGSYVFIAGGVNIVDTDFHPVAPAARLADTIAISTVGKRNLRPHFKSYPVLIEDDVWIGYNATILKGVTIGKGAIIEPGSVVSKDVPAGAVVSGNPAIVINDVYA
ncbi:acyltransferase [Aridibaculum aurantiacum]|uniref:acyltransferase n=1 Tax=Aridibaculum aurantiacum TaxID=2810307 RepID=UPI0024736136|nr:acyltransferase [Aridibaculum aurantiacum]